MTPTGLYSFFVLAAFLAANTPWLSDRFLMVFKRDKNAWLRWLEWLVMYALAGGLSVGLEYKLTGTRHPAPGMTRAGSFMSRRCACFWSLLCRGLSIITT